MSRRLISRSTPFAFTSSPILGKRSRKEDSEPQAQGNKRLRSLSIEPYTEPARPRATSSLLSDHSDGLPYLSRNNTSSPSAGSDGLFVGMSSQVPDADMGSPSAPESTSSASPAPAKPAVASMRAQFDISGSSTSRFGRIKGLPQDPSRSVLPKPFRMPSNMAATSGGRLSGAMNYASNDDHMEDIQDHAALNGESSEVDDEADSFYKVYRTLLSQHQNQTTFFEALHTEHAKALKKLTNLASRRKNRIDQLERENIALRKSLSSGKSHYTANEDLEDQLASTRRTVEMLTSDLSSWEKKYSTSQLALRSISDDAATFERKYNGAITSINDLEQQITSLREEITGNHEAIKAGSKQLKALQHVLRKVDDTLIEKIRELARLSGEWENQNGADEALRARVAGEMTGLVAAWREFEEEYEEGVSGDVE